MRPPRPQEKTEFERIQVYDEWLNAKIVEIKLEENHKFTFQGKEKLCDGVRFKFEVEGHNYPKYSRWMKYMSDERSTLYKVFLKAFFENAEPGMTDFDLDRLKDMKVKVMFSQNEDFDNLDKIKPLGAKVLRSTGTNSMTDDTARRKSGDEPVANEEDIPF